MSISSVLVVEDNHEVRRMVTASIKTLGDDIEVLEVPSAEEALVVSASQALDLIVLDIHLPGMSGLEMVARLRKRKPDTKLILVTGVDNDEVRKQVAEANASAYFFKPIEIQVFLEAVKRCLIPAQPPARSPTNSGVATAPISARHAQVRATRQGTAVTEPVSEEPLTTSYERLSALKKQVKAVAALLVNDAGQILEEAGTASDIATNSPLLMALMRAFRASLQVSQAMARGTSESLQYFAAPRQCIYISPVGLNHCLFVVTSGYFGPDRLGMLYHTIHLAVRDLQEILANEAASAKEYTRLDMLPPVAVDKETLARVEGMFSQAPPHGSSERADGFWKNVADSGADSTPNKEVLSYDQARELGLAPPDHEKG
jgi:CheY-like chemotaxis protein